MFVILFSCVLIGILVTHVINSHVQTRSHMLFQVVEHLNQVMQFRLWQNFAKLNKCQLMKYFTPFEILSYQHRGVIFIVKLKPVYKFVILFLQFSSICVEFFCVNIL